MTSPARCTARGSAASARTTLDLRRSPGHGDRDRRRTRRHRRGADGVRSPARRSPCSRRRRASADGATSSRPLGGPVNIGAAWLHGTAGHPLFEVVQPSRCAGRDEHVRADDDVPRPPTASSAERSSPSSDGCRQRSRRGSHRRESAAPGDNVADVLDPAIVDVATDATSATVLRSWMRGEYENLYAAPPADLSLRHHAEPFRLPGDDVMITVARRRPRRRARCGASRSRTTHPSARSFDATTSGACALPTPSSSPTR